ncbi:unnamed protein product, partial [Brenthis ino]
MPPIRCSFTFKEKVDIIMRLKNGESNVDLCKKFNVSHSTISTMWKNRFKIMECFVSKSGKIKKNRNSSHQDIESALLLWIKDQRSQNVPISGRLLQEKANHFAKLIGKTNFECSESWIYRFRQRHDIAVGKICRETASVSIKHVLSNQDIVLDQERHSLNEEVIMDQELPQSNVPTVYSNSSDHLIINHSTDGERESIVKDEKVTETESKDEKQDKKTQEKPSIDSTLSPKPLLPVNFLKSCKKNLAEMTREELEEFCILKIVESVVDRSNSSEMNLQLKSMALNIADYKKKPEILMKQNRVFQVVLKSIQEEQKKNSIIPLKKTRSIGIQVLIKETPSSKKFMTPNKYQNELPLNSIKSAKCQCPKSPKGQNQNNQQYHVPKIVPAVNSINTNNKVLIPAPIATKTKNSIPNGIKISPPMSKPEKRSYDKMQQGNSITEDLTDDEPPSKVDHRNIAVPAKLVPQQSLLTPQRPQFANSVNTSRKVYKPISGSQSQVGDAIVFQQLFSHDLRLQGPVLLPKPDTSVRMSRIAARHPAPLPDSIKQCQPPNWKALPPAPELKLSKVENGIVISWKINECQEENHEEIASYQLYAYQETSLPPNTALWKKIGDVKALPLPMACILTQFMAGYEYYFAVRAVDIRSRLGPFSLPGSILSFE